MLGFRSMVMFSWKLEGTMFGIWPVTLTKSDLLWTGSFSFFWCQYLLNFFTGLSLAMLCSDCFGSWSLSAYHLEHWWPPYHPWLHGKHYLAALDTFTRRGRQLCLWHSCHFLPVHCFHDPPFVKLNFFLNFFIFLFLHFSSFYWLVVLIPQEAFQTVIMRNNEDLSVVRVGVTSMILSLLGFVSKIFFLQVWLPFWIELLDDFAMSERSSCWTWPPPHTSQLLLLFSLRWYSLCLLVGSLCASLSCFFLIC